MDKLPSELLLIIFDYLSFIDLVRCRKVNSRFQKLVDSISLNELAIINFDTFYIKWSFKFDEVSSLFAPWFYDNKLISINRILLQNHDFTFLSSSTFRLNKLKRLKISNVSKLDKFKFEDLNKFDTLLQLEIYNHIELNIEHSESDLGDGISIGVIKCSIELPTDKLILPNLKVLKLDFNAEVCSEINCPNLEALYCNIRLNLIKFHHPESIRYLQVSPDQSDCISIFTNLEYYHCRNASHIDHNDVLSHLPVSLKELHLNESIDPDVNHYGRGFENIKNVMCHIIKQKKVLRRLDLKIYFNGIRLEDNKQFEDYDFQQKILNLHVKNYDSLVNQMSWFVSINYNQMMKLFELELPTDFFSKYNNIQKIIVGKVNQVNFIWFLKNCKCLDQLELIGTCFNQQFYDSLSKFGLLIRLKIVEKSDNRIDYKFIKKLPMIRCFTTNQILPKATFLDVYPKLKHIEFFKFLHFNKTIAIQNCRDHKYSFRISKYYESPMAFHEMMRLLMNILE